MKNKFLVFCAFCLCFFISKAQIPYFATAPGHNKLYGYTSLKFRPGINAQETYTTFQYGVGKGFATGVDLYTSVNTSDGGILLRYGLPINKWINVGLQITPSFNLKSNLDFDYLTSALYLNGAITSDSKLFWCANTWYNVYNHSSNTISQYLYTGYTFTLGKTQSLTPMIGTIYSWKFDSDADLALGAYWTVSNFNIYLWSNDLLKKHPRIIVGVDFLF